MRRTRVTLVNPLGLHARAAGRLVDVACTFEARCEVQYARRSADAKSIMSVMLLAASCGEVIEISTHGPDEEDALQALETLVNQGFGEV
jgi:phosphocarrier protein HPr